VTDGGQVFLSTPDRDLAEPGGAARWDIRDGQLLGAALAGEWQPR